MPVHHGRYHGIRLSRAESARAFALFGMQSQMARNPSTTANTATAEAATANAPTTLPAEPNTAEQAAQAGKILEAGHVKLGGVRVNVYSNVINELPRVKTEELIGREIIIFDVPGTIESAEYGEAWRVELAFAETPRDRLSWLCDLKTVMGRQIADQEKKHAFPLWLSVQSHVAGSGREYYSFETPERLLRAVGRWSSDAEQPDALEDLPF